MGLGQESFPVPELHVIDMVVGIIRMRIFGPQSHLHPELLTFYCSIIAENDRRMPVEIIFSYFLLFFGNINRIKYAGCHISILWFVATKIKFSELDPTMNAPNAGSVPALEVKELVKRYGEQLAVDHLSLEVRRGEIFGFLGPNGAGKTTSIRMMCGLLRPSAGEVLIGGMSIGEGGGDRVRSKVGICPQENILWSKLTCYEQLVFSARMYDMRGPEARQRAGTLLSAMGLEEKRNKLASTLSGGMKRRMNVILALMHDPEILVFDEPEAGLDPQSRVLVREFIKRTALQKTVIVTTHNMDEADRLADRVAIIDAGRLMRLDTPARLKRSIGEGDVLELKPSFGKAEDLMSAKKELTANGFAVTMNEGSCLIRSMDLVPKIHEIYQILERNHVAAGEMKVRENTLEDVFIHLTGKSLRV
jgi:ABC-2 type transport system ATP-binding protein